MAIVSDIHGNLPAFQAVLDDIDRQQVDRIVCAGDLVNPLKESLEIYRILQDRKIPILLGNHEEYLHQYLHNEDREHWQGANYRPIGLVAEHMGHDTVAELQQLPFEYLLAGPGGQNIYICHASPLSNRRSFYDDQKEDMAKALLAIDATVYASGHRHENWHLRWHERDLISFGSVGIPMKKPGMAEYLLLKFQGGRWQHEFRFVEYDHQATLQGYIDSGFYHRGGPIAWMLYDEILCAEKRVAPFMYRWIRQFPWPASDEEWAEKGRIFLEEVGRWNAVKKLL